MSSQSEHPPDATFPGRIARTARESEPAWPARPTAPAGAPNIVLLVLDDVGFAQPAAFGGACDMPVLTGLASTGLRFTNFHVTPLCSPTRACLLSGRNHHTVGVGSLVEMALGYPGYHATTGPEHAFLPAILRDAGYNTFAVGKWHLTPPIELSAAGPFRTWPLGRGFERFYGFMGGDTSQWFPDLVQDNTIVPPPARPEDGYHLNADLADHAVQMIKDAHVAAPDKPFFLYYATGAGHAPHHVEPEWADRFRGRFDDGWDVYRERALERQLAEGLVPPHTALSTRDPDVQAWSDLGADARRMFARQMEVYAGFLAQTDHHFGRVLHFLESMGELDNTLVVALSDNGASAEGGPEGTFNEAIFFNLVPERIEDNLRRYDDWGGTDTFPHYAWGWAWAGNAPFRRWKRETYRGGVSEPFVISWPAGIADSGGVRTQYAHAIDVLPTLLGAAGIPLPEFVDGIAQRPFHGASLVPTFADASAPSPRTTQYDEMHGSRAIYDDGWRAVCPFAGRSLAEAAERGRNFRLTELTPELLDDMDANDWELFDVVADPAETNDLSATEPARLERMVRRWYDEAEQYGAFPLASAAGRGFGDKRPGLPPPPTSFALLPDAAPLTFTVAPRLVGRSHSLEADVVVPEFGAEGVLVAQGGRHVGFALYMEDGRLHHLWNYVALESYRVSSAEPIEPGRHTFRYEFERTGKPVEFTHGRGVPARSKLYVDGALVGAIEMPHSLIVSLGFYGMTCGYAHADSVDPSTYRPPFRFTGEIRHVVVDTSGEVTLDAESELRQLMARQ